MSSIIQVGEDNVHLFLDDILAIERKSFLSPWSPKAFSDEVNRAVSYLWALLIDERLAGYICFWMLSDEIHLLNVAIHPDKRRMGFGQYLIREMIRAGKKQHAETAWLEVRPSNKIARSLYHKLGFIETDRRRGYYNDSKEDAIVMTLFLSRENNDKKMDEISSGNDEKTRLREKASMPRLEDRL